MYFINKVDVVKGEDENIAAQVVVKEDIDGETGITFLTNKEYLKTKKLFDRFEKLCSLKKVNIIQSHTFYSANGEAILPEDHHTFSYVIFDKNLDPIPDLPCRFEIRDSTNRIIDLCPEFHANTNADGEVFFNCADRIIPVEGIFYGVIIVKYNDNKEVYQKYQIIGSHELIDNGDL